VAAVKVEDPIENLPEGTCVPGRAARRRVHPESERWPASDIASMWAGRASTSSTSSTAPS